MCLLADVLVAAPACGEVVRSTVEVRQTGFLQWMDGGSLPWVNCSVMDSALPVDVFLGLGESYVFTVQLVINPLLAGTCCFVVLCP